VPNTLISPVAQCLHTMELSFSSQFRVHDFWTEYRRLIILGSSQNM
jgi:hypothetical protein